MAKSNGTNKNMGYVKLQNRRVKLDDIASFTVSARHEDDKNKTFKIGYLVFAFAESPEITIEVDNYNEFLGLVKNVDDYLAPVDLNHKRDSYF